MTHPWPVYLQGRVVSPVISQRLCVLQSSVLCHGDKTDLAVATLCNGLDLQKSSPHFVISVYFTSAQLTAVSSQSGQRQCEQGTLSGSERMKVDWHRATSGEGVMFPPKSRVSAVPFLHSRTPLNLLRTPPGGGMVYAQWEKAIASRGMEKRLHSSGLTVFPTFRVPSKWTLIFSF